jgi:hypothetical protein
LRPVEPVLPAQFGHSPAQPIHQGFIQPHLLPGGGTGPELFQPGIRENPLSQRGQFHSFFPFVAGGEHRKIARMDTGNYWPGGIDEAVQGLGPKAGANEVAHAPVKWAAAGIQHQLPVHAWQGCLSFQPVHGDYAGVFVQVAQFRLRAEQALLLDMGVSMAREEHEK